MWSEAPADLEAGGGGQKPLLPGNSGADSSSGTGTAAALDASQSTAIGSQGAATSPAQSPAAPNVNPDALANVKFKTTYVFELDTSAKVFLLLVGLEIAFFVFDRAYINPPADTDALWLLGVMVITAVFFAWFTVRAVWYEMKFDLIVCLIISGLVTVRAILEYTWVCDHATVVCVLLLVVVGIAQIGYLLLGWRVYQQMGRRFFKKARIADPKVHRAFFAYQKLSAVLKLDVVIVIVLIFTGLYYSSKDNVIAGIILSAVFLVSELLWEGVGLYFARKEDKRVSQIFRYVGLVVPAVYLVVLSVLFSRTHSDDADASGGEAEHSGTSLLSPFTKFITLAALGVANRLLVLWASYNFDKHMGNGLKEHYFDKNLE